jgi:hypothetical protein
LAWRSCAGSSRWKATARSPGRTFQATCDVALGDARCGVDLEAPAFKDTGAVIDLLRDRAFTASGLGGFTSGWFTFGTVDWTSGANAGRAARRAGETESGRQGPRPPRGEPDLEATVNAWGRLEARVSGREDARVPFDAAVEG